MSKIILQGPSHASEVGHTLRRFRERAGFSTRELARRTGVAASYVSKVELGQRGPQLEFCMRAAHALKLPRAERDLLSALLALHEVDHRSVMAGVNTVRQAQQAIEKLERTCTSYRMFQLSVIPGLLQTRAYAEAILARLEPQSHRMGSVRARLARQRILDDPERSFRVLLSDWALAAHWCSEQVMDEAHKRLLKLAKRPNIAIHVMPRDICFPSNVPPLVCGFEAIGEVAVVVDTLHGFTTFRNPDDAATYVRIFDKVFSEAPTLTDGILRESLECHHGRGHTAS